MQNDFDDDMTPGVPNQIGGSLSNRDQVVIPTEIFEEIVSNLNLESRDLRTLEDSRHNQFLDIRLINNDGSFNSIHRMNSISEAYDVINKYQDILEEVGTPLELKPI